MMETVLLGLLAALLWGLHDFTVRLVSVQASAAALFFVVLAAGLVLLFPFAVMAEGWAAMTPGLWLFSAAAGLVYTGGVYALYRAFTIGPVRVVAPICAAYPLLSVALAVVQGQQTSVTVWLAVWAVLGGIALVAQGDADTSHGDRRAAIGWSVAAALGFGAGFAMLHHAALQASDLPVTLVARAAGLLAILALILWQRIDLRPAFRLWPTLAIMGALDVGGMLAVTTAGSFPRPEFAAVTSSCFGLVTILLAWRFLGEGLTRMQGLGATVVFAGIATLGFV